MDQEIRSKESDTPIRMNHHEPYSSSPPTTSNNQKGDNLPVGRIAPENRHQLLLERNDLSSTVAAQRVAKSEQSTIESQILHQPDYRIHHPDTNYAHLKSTSSPTSPRKRGIPHVYRDFSNVPDIAGYVRKKTGGVTQPFPEKLHQMLEQANEPDVVAWLPHGRAFLVKNPQEFTDFVMPKYFRQTKLTSFQRQLNLYGFRRITQGPDAGAYYHELFLRGRDQLCMRMQRQKVKGTGHKQPADVKTEPNFYAMPPSEAHQYPSMTGVYSQATSKEGQHIAPIQNTTSTTTSNTTNDELSPGMRGLQEAAHVLETIAAGLPASSATSPFSLGQHSNPASPQSQPMIAQFQTSPKSLSLLGRVTQINTRHSDTSSPHKSTSPTSFVPNNLGPKQTYRSEIDRLEKGEPSAPVEARETGHSHKTTRALKKALDLDKKRDVKNEFEMIGKHADRIDNKGTKGIKTEEA